MEMSGDTFTKDEVAHLLDVQSIKTTLSAVVESLKTLTESVKVYSDKQDVEFHDIEEELRKSEVGQVRGNNKLRDELYGAFIKKKDLKIYLAIIVAAVSITTGVIQLAVEARSASVAATEIAQQNKVMVKEIVTAIKEHRYGDSE